ncbi:matrix Gla protein isoform X2 [Cololabis saira]|uniref:matrix Gla protein isoform X2 n=1 Tax=Cololabis saira TaxID=129043 RepID=UPI002AD39D50|nr:matrix Gla protein isoform X2 [Cololabis saira]
MGCRSVFWLGSLEDIGEDRRGQTRTDEDRRAKMSRRSHQEPIRMRSLLHFLALCAVVSLCVCYDSHESSESSEVFTDLFVPPNRANSFISPQRGNVFNLPRGNGFNRHSFMRAIKSPAERRAETCEDYAPCRFHAYYHGVQQAYQRFFGARPQIQQQTRPQPLHQTRPQPRQQLQRPARTRRF